MSNYGITAENANGQLTFSDNATTYGYIGRAVLQSITQPGTNVSSSTAGYSTYTIWWPADIIVAIALKSNGNCYLAGAARSGDTWTIQAYKSNGTKNSLGFDNQEPVEVFVFGAPIPTGGFGVSLYDDNGNIVCDLARRPLTYNALINMDATTNGGNFGKLSFPAIIGLSSGFRQSSTKSSGFWTNIAYGNAWVGYPTNDGIARQICMDSYSRDDGPVAVQSAQYPTSCLIIEAAGL